MQQFCSFYFRRLEELKPAVKETAQLKWDFAAEYVDNILDLKTNTKTVIIGTLFKEQKKKPCVFKDLLGVIKSETQKELNGCFVSDDDQAILEDSSGRINIRENENFKIAEQVTGSIVAIVGKADN